MPWYLDGRIPSLDNNLQIQSAVPQSTASSLQIVSLMLESILFGVYVVASTLGTSQFVRSACRHGSRVVRRDLVIILISAAVFLLVLADLGIHAHMTLHSDLDVLFPDNLSAALGQARFFIYVTQMAICEAFMIYRLFVVWGHRWNVTISPVMFLAVSTISGYLGPPSLDGDLFTLLAFPALSFLTTVSSAGLIMWRVLRTPGGIHLHSVPRCTIYRRVLEAVIQSAVIYCGIAIVLLVTFAFSPNCYYLACLSVFPPLTALVFSVVVIRMAKNSATSSIGGRMSHVTLRGEQRHIPTLLGPVTARTHIPHRPHFRAPRASLSPPLMQSPTQVEHLLSIDKPLRSREEASPTVT